MTGPMRKAGVAEVKALNLVFDLPIDKVAPFSGGLKCEQTYRTKSKVWISSPDDVRRITSLLVTALEACMQAAETVEDNDTVDA